MRICLVSQEYPPDTNSGGIASQTHTKARGLAALGHEVDAISAAAERTQNKYRDGPVRVTRIPGFHGRMPLNTELVQWLTYSMEVAATICTLHAQARFDLVDFPEWGCEGYVHLLNRTAWDPVPTVIQLHGPLRVESLSRRDAQLARG